MKAWVEKHTEFSAVLFSAVLLGITSLFGWDDNPVMGLDKLTGDILIIVLCIIAIRLLGWWDTAGFQRHRFFLGLLYGSPFLVMGIASVILSNAGMDLSQLTFISWRHAAMFTLNMILVGMNEEIWMRALILNGLVRKYGRSKKAVWKAILVSALIFGAIHIPNVFFMDPLTLLVQVVNAAAGGVLFAAIFIKTNNITANIVLHAIVDWCSLFIAQCFIGADSVLSMQMSGLQALGIMVAGSAPPILISIALLHKYQEA